MEIYPFGLGYQPAQGTFWQLRPYIFCDWSYILLATRLPCQRMGGY